MTNTQRARLAALRTYERNYRRTARQYPTPRNLREWADAIERREAYERQAAAHVRTELRSSGERGHAERSWTATCSCGWSESARTKRETLREWMHHEIKAWSSASLSTHQSTAWLATLSTGTGTRTTRSRSARDP